jgi:hypothetical protein
MKNFCSLLYTTHSTNLTLFDYPKNIPQTAQIMKLPPSCHFIPPYVQTFPSAPCSHTPSDCLPFDWHTNVKHAWLNWTFRYIKLCLCATWHAFWEIPLKREWVHTCQNGNMKCYTQMLVICGEIWRPSNLVTGSTRQERTELSRGWGPLNPRTAACTGHLPWAIQGRQGPVYWGQVWEHHTRLVSNKIKGMYRNGPNSHCKKYVIL